MLQRAASNAYSWWWASHVRTKQSKWLEQSLSDMEDKVHYALKLIEEDGDSFAKRAEMYYKKRPELINFVEESYRAYRALAERYNKLSSELQNANNTLASVFPEQVQFAMDDEDEDGLKAAASKSPGRDSGGDPSKSPSKLQSKKPSSAGGSTSPVVEKSGLSKAEAIEEIDKLQKEILGLQTVKEYVKSSYESGVAKYWEIENQITEKQERVCKLQDEFGVSKVIEDDEARAVMADAALKSCQQTLIQLQEKQEKTAEEAKAESKRVEEASTKIESLKQEFLPNETEQENQRKEDKETSFHKRELEVLEEKIKEHFDVDADKSLTATEMADKIDELVNKVIGLESAVSSQNVLINSLRTETNDLHSQIKKLEDEKATLINDANSMTCKLREMEVKLHGIQDLNQNVEKQNNTLQTHFSEARNSIDRLSEKIHSVKPDEEDTENERYDLDAENYGSNWQQMLLSGLEDKENILLTEYTTILRNYKDVRKELGEVEKKNNDSLYDMTEQLREMRSAIEKRDEEILYLRKKLNSLHDGGKDAKNEHEKIIDLIPEVDVEIIKAPVTREEEDIKSIFIDEPRAVSPVEEKLQRNINAVLDKNLGFWLRFCTSLHQIRKFKTEIKDLQEELLKLKEKDKAKPEGSGRTDLKSDVRAIYKHMSEIQTSLTVWLDRNALLKDELQHKVSSLSQIQEQIATALNEGGAGDGQRLSNYQAAKYQGEVTNMKHESNKVRDELQAGLDHVTLLHLEIDKTLGKLNEEYKLSGQASKSQSKNSASKTQIPLRSFIFGIKPKKKHSIFACMAPALLKK